MGVVAAGSRNKVKRNDTSHTRWDDTTNTPIAWNGWAVAGLMAANWFASSWLMADMLVGFCYRKAWPNPGPTLAELWQSMVPLISVTLYSNQFTNSPNG